MSGIERCRQLTDVGKSFLCHSYAKHTLRRDPHAIGHSRRTKHSSKGVETHNGRSHGMPRGASWAFKKPISFWRFFESSLATAEIHLSGFPTFVHLCRANNINCIAELDPPSTINMVSERVDVAEPSTIQPHVRHRASLRTNWTDAYIYCRWLDISNCFHRITPCLFLSQLEECKTSWREGPKTGESWGVLVGRNEQVRSAHSFNLYCIWDAGITHGERLSIYLFVLH